MDLPISGEDKICIPPLKNFVMNRISGDYFENLLYKIFVSADEHSNISELALMLQVSLDTVKQAVSLFCRLGFAKKKNDAQVTNMHESWNNLDITKDERLEVTPLNFHALLVNETNSGFVNSNGDAIVNETSSANTSPNSNVRLNKTPIGSNSNESDGNISDFSIISSMQETNKKVNKKELESPNRSSSELEETGNAAIQIIGNTNAGGKRILFLFDATLTAFLMMGNLSPGLKNHAVTMFEVGKLCDESIDSFLAELEKVSLLDAEGEGEVSRYFAHAIILRSTIIALRNIVDAGIDLLRLECLENLDFKTRDRLLEKKYK